MKKEQKSELLKYTGDSKLVKILSMLFKIAPELLEVILHFYRDKKEKAL